MVTIERNSIGSADNRFSHISNIRITMTPFQPNTSIVSMSDKAVCVFCGSRAGNGDEYRLLAETIGRGLAERGASVVYGGGDLGMMGLVSNNAVDAGAHVTGIIPGFLEDLEITNPRITRNIRTDGMMDRKQAMFDLSDAFLILPGGLGTLDELFEVLTWRQLGQIDKPVVLLSLDNYWRPFADLIDHVISAGFADHSTYRLYSIVDNADDAYTALGL